MPTFIKSKGTLTFWNTTIGYSEHEGSRLRMSTMLTLCPVCGERLTVARLHCRACSTSIEGQFDQGPLGRLTVEQLAFVETFVRCEGKLNRMEREVGLSYPTLRSRLAGGIPPMGYTGGPGAPTGSAEGPPP